MPLFAAFSNQSLQEINSVCRVHVDIGDYQIRTTGIQGAGTLLGHVEMTQSRVWKREHLIAALVKLFPERVSD